MSRQSGKKSTADRNTGKGSASAGGGPAAGQAHDFIPSRFNLSDWTSLLRDEEDSGFVGDIVDDIITKVLDTCEQVHLKKQLMPYTLLQTKNTLLGLIQWHFLAPDSGEQNFEQWQEEDEPEPSVIDSWAQGSVPVVINNNPPSPDSQIKTPPSKRCKDTSELRIDSTHSPDKFDSHQGSETGNTLSSPECGKKSPAKKVKVSLTVKSSESSNHEDSKESQKTSSKDRTTGTKAETVSSEAAVMPKIKSTTAHRHQPNEIIYDSDGFIVQLQKIKNDELPDYQVNVAYRVVSMEHDTRKVNAAQQAQEAATLNKLRRRGRNSAETSKRKKSILLRNLTEKFSTMKHPTTLSAETSLLSISNKGSETKIDPTTPRLIEAIEACPGVVVREGALIKKGPSEEQQLLLGSTKDRVQRRRYLNVNIDDTTNLRLLPTNKELSSSLQRHSVLPAIPTQEGATKRNIEAS